MTNENLELGKAQFAAGKSAFERGHYRQSVQLLEKAINLVGRNTRLGGEAQIWLVTAYEAAEERESAIALCEALGAHPDFSTRKQSRRLLYILKAPRLKTRPEWLTQIPDLTSLDGANAAAQNVFMLNRSTRPARPKPTNDFEPIDLSQVNTQDNRFVWLALLLGVIVLGSLAWFA